MFPQSLFARTALLIASTLAVFSVIAWQAIIWTTLVPAAQLATSVLTQRANEAIAARRMGAALPEGTRFEVTAPLIMEPRYGGLAIRTYAETIRAKLQGNLDAPEARIHRYTGPPEIWVRTREVPDAWLVLSWRIAGPRAPLAAVSVIAAAALLVLGAAALSARRMTAPLADLSRAAARLAEGERLTIASGSGPSEVRSLAVAFRSMAQRMAELNEQRELMLAGISHDLRTPLARLRVAVELIGAADAVLTQEMVANIEEMDRMIAQFLHYARANYRENPMRASLDEVVRQTLAIYATDQRVQLELRAPENRLFAADSVRHALLNLVQNALEYGRPPVTIRTSSSAGEIQIEVHDRGPGLSEAEWSEAVRPFHRLRDQPGGTHTGLGLAMVERLVQVSGGSLEAKRTVDGFAATVRLPADLSL